MPPELSEGKDLAERRAGRRQRRRATIVATSARLFVERGYETTSINDLAAALGMSAGGLYRYISTKADLLVMVCDDIYGELPEALRQVSTAGGPVGRRLEAACRAYLQACAANRELILLMYREYRHLPDGAQREYMRREGEVAGVFEDLLAESRSGVPSAELDVRVAARDIIVLGHLPALKSWALPDADDVVESQLAILRRLLGLQTRSAATSVELTGRALRWSSHTAGSRRQRA